MFRSQFVVSAANSIRCISRKYSTDIPAMVTKHFKQGDPQPPLQKGVLRVYSMKFCPYAQRAHLVLDAKKITYDTVFANLTTKPEWLFQKSEGGKVPALEFEDGVVMAESLIISDYLDEAYPQIALYPKDPRAKALDRLLINKFDTVIKTFYGLVIHKEFTPEKFEELNSGLTAFEKELVKRGTPFFGGATPGMVDFMIWPWIERIPLIETLSGDAFKLPEARLPVFTRWVQAMLANEAVQKSYLRPVVHLQYLAHRKEGIYDFEHNKL